MTPKPPAQASSPNLTGPVWFDLNLSPPDPRESVADSHTGAAAAATPHQASSASRGGPVTAARAAAPDFPPSQKRKPRLRELRGLALGHPASEWRSHYWTPGSLVPESLLLTPTPPAPPRDPGARPRSSRRGSVHLLACFPPVPTLPRAGPSSSAQNLARGAASLGGGNDTPKTDASPMSTALPTTASARPRSACGAARGRGQVAGGVQLETPCHPKRWNQCWAPPWRGAP